MIRWICNVKAKDEVSSDSLLTKLGIQDLDVVLCTGRMRWFGHVERSTGWISEVRKLNVVAQKRSGRPRKSWDEVIKNDRKKLDMDSADPQNRSEWKGRLRGIMKFSSTEPKCDISIKNITGKNTFLNSKNTFLYFTRLFRPWVISARAV